MALVLRSFWGQLTGGWGLDGERGNRRRHHRHRVYIPSLPTTSLLIDAESSVVQAKSWPCTGQVMSCQVWWLCQVQDRGRVWSGACWGTAGWQKKGGAVTRKGCGMAKWWEGGGKGGRWREGGGGEVRGGGCCWKGAQVGEAR